MTVAIAALLFYLDKNYQFKQVFNVTAALVVVYFVISGVMLVINRQNKDVKYVGYAGGRRLTVSGWTTKFDAVYHMRLVRNGDDKTAVVAALEFGKFFDITGYLNRDELTRLVKAEVDKLGKKTQ